MATLKGKKDGLVDVDRFKKLSLPQFQKQAFFLSPESAQLVRKKLNSNLQTPV